MQTYRPDTCAGFATNQGCYFEEDYDGSVMPPVFKGIGKIFHKCEAHKDVSDDELYGVITGNTDSEMKRKSLVLRILMEEESVKDLGLLESKINPSGDLVKVFKPGVDYNWQFFGSGKSRVLKWSVKGAVLSDSQKLEIQSIFDTKLGVGKAEVL